MELTELIYGLDVRNEERQHVKGGFHLLGEKIPGKKQVWRRKLRV